MIKLRTASAANPFFIPTSRRKSVFLFYHNPDDTVKRGAPGPGALELPGRLL